jgi:hypothetical protein
MALNSEEHYHARTWQVQRFSGPQSRTWEFLRRRLAPYRLRKPTLGSFDRFDQHAVGLRSSSSGVMLLHRYAYKPSSIVVGGYQDDCYKVLDSCILASVLDKGKLAAR